MKKHSVTLIILLLFNLLLPAQWSGQTYTNTRVCMAPEDQEMPLMIATEEGGVIIVWYDERSGSESDIYAQKLDSAGMPLWTQNGLAICTATSWQYDPVLCTDGSGGAYIAWRDHRSANDAIYMQRVRSNGSFAWASDGMIVASSTGDQRAASLSPDMTGGVWAAITDDRGGVQDRDIFLQRLDSTGQAMFPATGITICTLPQDQDNVSTDTDGDGSVFISWEDGRQNANYYTQIFVQKVDTGGNVVWAQNGVQITGAGQWHEHATIVADGAGGAAVAWQTTDKSQFPETSTISAQRLDTAGNALWGPTGSLLATDVTDQAYDPLAHWWNGPGGPSLFVSWYFVEWPSANGVYLKSQKVDAAGNSQWQLNGRQIFKTLHSTAAVPYPRNYFVPDNNGNTFYVGNENPTQPSDYYIFVQQVDTAGQLQYNQGTYAAGPHYLNEYPVVVKDIYGRFIVAWGDKRIITDRNIYAECIRPDGTLCDSKVSVKDPAPDDPPIVFPNPATAGSSTWLSFTLDREEKTVIKIFGVDGKGLSHTELMGRPGENRYTIKNLPRGIFFLQLRNPEMNWRGKIVIK